MCKIYLFLIKKKQNFIFYFENQVKKMKLKMIF